MLTDELMEVLGMPNFDEIVDIELANLKITKVEELRDQSVDTIQNMSQVYISQFNFFIINPAKIRAISQGFIDILLNTSLHKVRYLKCNSKLQLDHSNYQDITDMWDVYSKWKNFVTNSC